MMRRGGMKSYIKHPGSLLLLLLVFAAAAVTAVLLFSLTGYILIRGLPYLKPGLFAPVYNSDNVSMLPAIVNTVETAALALLFAVPFGVGAAVYLVEYAGRGSGFVELVRLAAGTLTGIPSIIYGLFGMLFFGMTARWGFSILSGAATLAVMILPTVLRTAEEALLGVPDAYREGSLGLGAGKLRTVFGIVLPAAMPGILSGVILSVGRIVGETAALIYTAGTVAGMAGLMDSGRTLAVHMYVLSGEGLHENEADATAVVLLLLVFLINGCASRAAKRMTGPKNRD